MNKKRLEVQKNMEKEIDFKTSKFVDLGISPIKCNNKETNEQLKEIQYKINDILFKYQYRYLIYNFIIEVRDEIINTGKELRGLNNIPSKFRPKRDELILTLQNYYKILNNAANNYNQYVDSNIQRELIERTLKYQTSKYLKMKTSNTLSLTNVLNLLDENVELAKIVNIENLPQLNQAYDKSNIEMIKYIDDYYNSRLSKLECVNNK